MAKGQKRSNREPKKQKGAENKAKKRAGPKYLRQSEILQLSKNDAQRIGQK